MTTTTPFAATTFINIGERTNVTGGHVMLGLGPSIHSAAKEGSLGIRGAASAALRVSSWILGISPRMTVGGASGDAGPRLTAVRASA
jgi:hypothetical protein